MIDIKDLTPDFDENGKKIYVVIGEFTTSDGKNIFRLQVLMTTSSIGENDFIIDGGDSSTKFERGIDFGNSTLTDIISKWFKIYSDHQFLEELEFDSHWSKEIKIDDSYKLNQLELEQVIGYIYPILQELKIKNKNYIFIEY